MLGKEDDGRWVEELSASSSLFLKHHADLIQVEFLRTQGFSVSHACCSVLAHDVPAIQGISGHANSLFLGVFWACDWGNKQVLIQTAFLQKSKLFPFCKQYQVYYFVPKDTLHVLFRIFFIWVW